MYKKNLEADKYTKTEHTTSFVKANLYALVHPLPFMIPYVLIFIGFRVWLPESMTLQVSNPFPNLWFASFIALFLFLAVFVILHELVHAAFFLPACEGGRKSIIFGVKQLTPFCHCEEILTLQAYRRSCLAPLWVICLPVAVLSLFIPNWELFLLTLIMISGSGGDLWIVWVLRKYDAKTTLVYDRDDVVGCDVYVPIENSGKSPVVTSEESN